MDPLLADGQITAISTLPRSRAVADSGETPSDLLEDHGGASPLIIKDLTPYPQPRPPPAHPHSTWKSQYSGLLLLTAASGEKLSALIAGRPGRNW